MIARLVRQKGVDLVPEALREICDQDWQAIILGTGDTHLENIIRQLDMDLPQVRALIKYDGGLSRRIYSGSDLMLIPSYYEPCGLTQMISMRYGCVPLARATGGLKDTIEDYHLGKPNHSTGFLFDDDNPKALAETISRALHRYQDQRRWKGLQCRGMSKAFSLHASAKKYYALYRELVGDKS